MLNKLERCHSRYSISHTTRQILKKRLWNMIFDPYANKSTDYFEIGFLLLGGFISFDLTFS